MATPYNILFVATSISISSLLSKYPLQIPPSLSLDIVGRIINTYQVLVHIIATYQWITLKQYNTVYEGRDEQQLIEFLLTSSIDYFGWLVIFSRLQYVPYTSKVIANAHMATSIMAILDFDTFQNLYVRTSYDYRWILVQTVFLLTDGLLRGYYQFFVL
jgi:hypothetical protein